MYMYACVTVQSLLDADIKPLSPTNEHLMNFTTRQSLHTNIEDDMSHQESCPQPVLVPAYSIPGAADDEVTFETWRKQQHQQRDIVPSTQQVYSIPPSLHYPVTHHQTSLRDGQTRGESTPSGCSETKSEAHSDDLGSSEWFEPRQHVHRAWGSQTQLLDGEAVEDCRSTHHTPSRAPSSATQVKDTQRKEKIINDW